MTTNKLFAASVLAFGLSLSGGAFAHDGDSMVNQVGAALQQCRAISPSCAREIKTAYGILVFPTVTKADFIIGGSGGQGALVENEHITGYYNIGSGSIGLQAGAEQASQIYVFRSPKALSRLKDSQDWHAGSDAGATLISNDSNKKAVTGDVLAYVFDAQGLHGGIAIEAFDIWKTHDSKHEPSVSD